MNNVNNNGGNNPKSNIPLLIIGAVLLAAIVGGWLFYSTTKDSKKPNPISNTAVLKSPTPDMAEIIRNAPAGAQPANMLGSPTAAVTVEEFADYQCPTCATVHPMMQELTKTYGNRIKFVYRSFPLTQIHQHAYEAATAAEAAGLQGKFWEMQTQLFSNQKEWSISPEATKLFEGYAQKIGLDVPKYQNDILGLATKARVDADMMRGRKIGVNGTPSIYINGQPLAYELFNVEAMRKVIDGELQKAVSQPTGQASNQSSNQTSTNNQPGNVAVVSSNNNSAKTSSENSVEKK